MNFLKENTILRDNCRADCPDATATFEPDNGIKSQQLGDGSTSEFSPKSKVLLR